MDHPKELNFTDLDVPVASLLRRGQQGPMHRSWTRVQFEVPDAHEASKAVEAWLTGNCSSGWETYQYQSPRGKNSEHIMVVKFENRDEALMFKLRGGHQAWEIT
jgi:hypothetical protein